MSPLTTKQRIRRAFITSGLLRGIRVAEQIVLIPLLLGTWGLDRYGEWVALMSVASIAGAMNLGIGHTAAADIVLQYAAGNTRRAAQSFVTAMALTTAGGLIGAAILAAAAQVIDFHWFMSTTTLTPGEARVIFLLLGLWLLVSFYIEPLAGVIGAVRGAGVPNASFAAGKAVEIVGIGIAVYLGAGPVAVAAIILSATTLTVLVDLALAIHCAKWLSFRLSDFDPGAIRRVRTAAFGFFCIHVSTNLINLHVPRLIVIYSLGPAALSIFTVFVTYTRAARNFALMVSQATQVEIGKAFAGDGREAARALLVPMARNALRSAGVLLAAELALAPFVIPAWTHGHVAVDWPLLTASALVALAGTYFDAVLVAVSAFNRVAPASIFYAAGLVVGIGAALALLPWLGLVAVAGVGMLAPEVIGAFGATMTIRSLLATPRTKTFATP